MGTFGAIGFSALKKSSPAIRIAGALGVGAAAVLVSNTISDLRSTGKNNSDLSKNSDINSNNVNSNISNADTSKDKNTLVSSINNNNKPDNRSMDGDNLELNFLDMNISDLDLSRLNYIDFFNNINEIINYIF
jgi:hypothetical protein